MNLVYAAVAGAGANLTGVIGVCSSTPDSIASLRVSAPTPAPTPTVPYVVVTTYAASNCQGTFSGAINFIIGACTAVPGSTGYGVVSVVGTVRRHDDMCANECVFCLFIRSLLYSIQLQ